MKRLLIVLLMLTALPALSQDGQRQRDSSALDLETLQYVESELRVCERIRSQSIKDLLTIAQMKSANKKLQAAVNALEMQKDLEKKSGELTGLQLEVEKKKKPTWWKTSLVILTAALAGYGAGSL
ncbi:hypothetical protein E0K83_03920 [Gramella sp. BOM4]|nr:hypothetical protein [Christiangramia bathymodioli]